MVPPIWKISTEYSRLWRSRRSPVILRHRRCACGPNRFAVARRNFGELDHLLRRIERVRHIDQTRGESKGAFFHGLGDEVLHLFHFGRRGRPVLIAHDRGAYLSRPDIGDNVRSYAFLFQKGKEAAQRGPGSVNGRRDHHRVVHGGPQHRPAEVFAQDLGGYALRDLAECAAVSERPKSEWACMSKKPGSRLSRWRRSCVWPLPARPT